MSNNYKAPRGPNFKDFVFNFAMMGNTDNKPTITRIMNTRETDKVFDQAFTSKKYDETYNYEVFEQLGDVTVNKFLVWYSYKRFPQLFCPSGVKIVARNRINLGAKTVLSSIAQKYGFWTYISSTREQRSEASERIDLLEDTFEAMFGAIEFLCTKYTGHPGVGYEICSNILTAIFDTMDISLKHNELIDAKTRLKELYDRFPTEALEYDFTKSGGIGVSTISVVPKINIDTVRVPRDDVQRLTSLATREGIQIIGKLGNKVSGSTFSRRILATGTATDKKAAEAEAAKNALIALESEGVIHPKKDEDPYKCLLPQFSF